MFAKFHSFTAKARSLHLEFQVHLLSIGIFFASEVLKFTSPSAKFTQQILVFVSLFGFAIGFSIWCWPTLKKVWAHPLGKTLIAAFHILVLFLSTVLSRFIVASSLGLPPQDFDLTVSAISIISYFPAWSIVTSIVLCFAVIILQFAGFGAMFANPSIGPAAKFFARMLGALVICFAAASNYEFVMKNQSSLHSTVKWIAYFCDFQPAPNYPGIAVGERIRLHENGVISVAEILNRSVQIRVRKYEQSSDCLQAPTPPAIN